MCKWCDCEKFETVDKSNISKQSILKFADPKNNQATNCECGFCQYVFDWNGENVVTDLIEIIFEQNNNVWIAHNGSQFDTTFCFVKS